MHVLKLDKVGSDRSGWPKRTLTMLALAAARALARRRCGSSSTRPPRERRNAPLVRRTAPSTLSTASTQPRGRQEMQTQPVAIRERDIVYQFKRIVSMSQLIRAYPASGRYLMEQATDDVPPLVRASGTHVPLALGYVWVGFEQRQHGVFVSRLMSVSRSCVPRRGPVSYKCRLTLERFIATLTRQASMRSTDN